MERPNGEGLSESEQFKLELREYLQDASVGDPKYQAFFDHFSLDELTERLDKVTTEKRLILGQSKTSSLRIIEARIALQEHAIEQKKIQIPGYQDAEIMVWGKFDELAGIVRREAKAKYPKDKNAVDAYADRRWETIVGEIAKELYERAWIKTPKDNSTPQ
jgi:hypothetical protein